MKLHNYQLNAIKFCLEKKTVFLAMDMGLGKTAVALKVVQQLRRPAIVFCPLRPMYTTWPEELKKWTPDLTYDILHGLDKDQVLRESTADILFINFHGIKWFKQAILKRKKWRKRILIIDESSMIKSPSTIRFKTLKKLFPLWDEHRLCLSATPAPNGYHELWTQYYVLDKGERLYESFHRFRSVYFHYTGPPIYKTTIRRGAYESIVEKIKPITYRLEGKDYLELPKEIYNDISLELPPKLRQQYKDLEDDFFLEFLKAEITAFSAAALSMKLRQFLQGALYTDAGKGDFYPLHQLKIEALKEVIEGSAGQPILCPIQFKFELKMIRAFIDEDIPCIAGGTKNADANNYIRMWNKGELPLLLCHPASIGHGTNLQSGGHIILWYGLPWSLEHYQQLNGRLARQGQTNDRVVINHLLIKDTVDDRVVKVLKQKDATQAKLLTALKRR